LNRIYTVFLTIAIFITASAQNDLYASWPTGKPNTQCCNSISYQVKDTCSVSLAVYNVLGEILHSFEDSIHQPGSYIEDLELLDLSSGVYFYKLEICNSIVTKKLQHLSDARNPGNILESYIAALLEEDWDNAKKYWYENDNRLKIKFTDIPLKIDCASPLLSALTDIRSGRISYTIERSKWSGEYQITDVCLVYNADTLIIPYYTEYHSWGGYIVTPIKALTNYWNTIYTDFTNVNFNDTSLVNKSALDALDESIINICKILGTSQEKVQQLKKNGMSYPNKTKSYNKIQFYLCTEEQFEQITGYNAHGIANLQVDAIVTRHLPHPHELTHLLMNYTLGELPLYTLPILQEGLAVAIGGRWGKTPEVVMQIAPALIKNDICKLDDILTWNGFQNEVAMADISYPISGIFVDLLIQEFGIEKFKKIYLDLSGSNSEVQSFTKSEIKGVIEKHTGKDWQQINDLFDYHWPGFEFSGIFPGGETDPDKDILQINSGTLNLSVYESENSYVFNVRSENDKPEGVILFTNTSLPKTPYYISWMFAEHLPDMEYHDELYGIQFNPDEVGLYNYITNILEAKYIASFSPDSNYWDSENNMLTFSINKDAFVKSLNEYVINLVK
jgi:hypothetical protein